MTRNFQEDKRRYWGTPVPPRLLHGPKTRACSIYGCPCEDCHPPRRKGTPGRERHKKSRHKLKGTPVPLGTKHGVYTYRTYNCRCNICVAARAAETQRRQNVWKLTARGVWTEDPETTRLCWNPKCPDHPRQEAT